MTHKVTDAIKVADRFMYVKHGTIAFDGDIIALKDTGDLELRKFTDEIHTAGGVKTLPQEVE